MDASPPPASRSRDPFTPPPGPYKGQWLLITVIVLCLVIEAILVLADYGVIGPARLRNLAYQYGGFWPGLMRSWDPNYALQPYTMFFTYGFLHGGITHLIVNMLTLWTLGAATLARVGLSGFVLLYTASLLGGGLGFGLLASNLSPMVGASGALFGLAGGLLAWAYVDRFTLHRRLWPVARTALFLVIMNVVLYWSMDGQLAWETHLGGFVAGWIMALLIDPRGRS